MRTLRHLCLTGVLLSLATLSFAALTPTWTVKAPAGVNSYTVTNKALTGNVATLTIGAHTLVVGDAIAVALNPPDPVFDAIPAGTSLAITAVTATTISYARTNPNVASVAAAGTVLGPVYLNTGGQGRGMGYNAATNHLLIASYANFDPMIAILDANTGAYVGKLQTAAVVTNAQCTTATLPGTCTLTTSVAHGLQVGQYAIVAMNPANPIFDGTFVITAVTANTITYTNGTTEFPSAPAAGTINNIKGKGFLMPIKVKAVNGAIYSTPMTLNGGGTNAGQDYP